MKALDLMYAHIFHWYAKMASKGRNIDPQRLTSMLFAVCATGWILLAVLVYYARAKNDDPGYGIFFLSFVALGLSWVINRVYARDNRYLKVYYKYVQPDNVRRNRKAMVLSMAFIYIPYVLSLLVYILW